MQDMLQTLTHEGGKEPRRATILRGTVKAYGLDFHLLKASFNSLSSKFSVSSHFPTPSLSMFRKTHCTIRSNQELKFSFFHGNKNTYQCNCNSSKPSRHIGKITTMFQLVLSPPKPQKTNSNTISQFSLAYDMVTQSMNNTMLGSSLLKLGPVSSRTCFDPPLHVPKGARFTI